MSKNKRTDMPRDKESFLKELRDARKKLVSELVKLTPMGEFYVAVMGVMEAIDKVAYLLTGNPQHFYVPLHKSWSSPPYIVPTHDEHGNKLLKK